jgi:hypothetical protein
MATGPYLKEVRKFLRSADWLGEEHAPMVVHLKSLAQTLDKELEESGKVPQGIAGVFGVTWGRLQKPVDKTAKKDEETDPILNFS